MEWLRCICAPGERDKGDVRDMLDVAHGESTAHDEDFEPHKPVSRGCTDIFCLLIFAGYLAAMSWISLYAVEHGDMRKLTSGIDWQGRLCGLSEGVENAKYLYWCQEGELLGDTPAAVDTNFPICVSECPTDTSRFVHCPQDPDEDKQTSMQGDDLVTIVTVTQTTKEMSTYPSKLVAYNFCVPNGQGNEEALEQVKKSIISSLQHDKVTNFFHELGSLWHEDNMYLFVGVMVGALLMSFVYLILLRYFAKTLLYITLTITVLIFLCAGVGLLMLGIFPDGCIKLSGSECTLRVNYENAVGSAIFEYFEGAVGQTVATVCGGVSVVVAFSMMIVMCCAGDTIEIAVGCLEMSVSAMSSMPTLLMQPVVSALIKAGILLTLLYCFIHLIACGDVQQEKVSLGATSVSGLNRSLTYTQRETYMLFIYGFGIVWIVEVCNAFQTLVVAYATVVWYYMPKNEYGRKGIPLFPVLRAFFVAVIFHTGTMAVGAFLIAVVRVIQFVFYLISKHAESENNRVAACIAKGCMCCLECFEKCLAGINKNAYIHCAIHSTDFMESSIKALEFITHHLSEITVLNGATFIAQFTGVLTISGSGAFVTWLVLSKGVYEDHKVENMDMACGVAGFLCLAVSSVFMILLDDVSDTLLYTYSDNKQEDLASVPRFAPDELSDLVDAHKDKHVDLHERRAARI